MGFAFAGRASVILFCTTLVEKSASVALFARWLMTTGFRASGDMVATYWSVLVTVVIAHVENTEIGINIDASTTKTHTVIPRSSRPGSPFRSLLLGGCRGGALWRRRRTRVSHGHTRSASDTA